MNKSRMLIFIIIISSLMFSACTMSASTPPPVTPTTNLSEIARQATETAIAKTPKTGETQVTEATQKGEMVATSTASGVEDPTSTPEPTEVPKTSVPDPVEYAVPDSYTLHKGEFVWCLARRFNILPADIMVYNGYESGDVLSVGETIQLPSGSRAYIGDRSLQYHPASYTVIYGDTLYSIACLFGDVDPRAIAAANDLDVDQSLTAGTVLQIP